MDDDEAREELRLRLAEAEAALMEAEAEYERYSAQLHQYGKNHSRAEAENCSD